MEEQRIGFCVVDGRRVAFAVVGDGAPLVFPAWWFSHLEDDWAYAPFRALLLELAAAGHAVIRYDRVGTGLSDRTPWPAGPSLEAELATLEAVVDAVGARSLSCFGMSCGGCLAALFAVRYPSRVRRLVLYGSYADGRLLGTPAVRELLLSVVRTHWGLGARVLTDVFLPDGTPEERRQFERTQRTAARPAMAADLLALAYSADARAAFAELQHPVLVLHRRGDRAVPFEAGRLLAASIPGARLVPLDGRRHVLWLGQTRPVLAATTAFLDEDWNGAQAAGGDEQSLLTAREREVLSLVAGGLGDEQIAATLVVSPHTVHRHVANIRAKLGQPTRTAAAVDAARRQLI